LLCTCWDHRKCVDSLADKDASAYPLAVILEALAAMEVACLDVCLQYDKDRRTNVCLTVAGRPLHIGVVYASDLNAEGTERALWGQRLAKMVDSPYIVLGTGGRLRRPPLAGINPSRAAPSGGVRASSSTSPVLRALYYDGFQAALEQGTLPTALQGLIGTP
jgi:hypothetical protein